MSKKHWEPELPLGPRLPPRNRTSDRLTPKQIEGMVADELIAYHAKHYERIHGFSPARFPNEWRCQKITQLINHLCSGFFKDHDKQWRLLARYSGPEDYRDLVEARSRISCDWIDWIVANHFRKMGLSDMASEYWLSRYCEYLAKERLKALGTGTWDTPSEQKKSITESWD